LPDLGATLSARLGLPPEAATVLCASVFAPGKRQGFLLDALHYGPPPHGGIAFGWDRLIMLLAARDTIRDVIAFPKAASGADPLTGAPTPITLEQRREAGIDVIVPPDGDTPDPDPRKLTAGP